MPTYGRRENPQVNEGTPTRERFQHPPASRRSPRRGGTRLALQRPLREPGTRTARRARLGDSRHPGGQRALHQPGRVYVGWLPEDTTAWKRGIVWQVRVHPSDAEPWIQEFGVDTPSEAVAGFLAALIASR
ncbi:DUF317 domain-containing protein [Streptomyces sp. NPDC127072]|uniref:DUF317 domain-containing protein n=1 Tax=Streptomyces sp. NPDC127072 TaxID=3347129 RepID=UPI003656EBCD